MTTTNLTHGQRKFRRLWKGAGLAREIRRFQGRREGKDYTVIVKFAMRSKGYASNYEQVPAFWVFLWEDGIAVQAWTATENTIQGFYDRAEATLAA